MRAWVILFLSVSFLFIGNPATAHRLNVFAWLENDQILVDCNFGKDRPATNATVMVLDGNTNKEILDGHTTEQGRFSFPVPDVVREGHSLLIQVNAGEGHQGQWSMDASELYAAASLAAGFEDASLKEGHPADQNANVAFPAGGASAAQIRTIVQSALDTQLAPLRQQLAALNSRAPTITEIIGGLGWIMGLAGIALYYKSRKNSKNGS